MRHVMKIFVKLISHLFLPFHKIRPAEFTYCHCWQSFPSISLDHKTSLLAILPEHFFGSQNDIISDVLLTRVAKRRS